jgi:hypothetical protein
MDQISRSSLERLGPPQDASATLICGPRTNVRGSGDRKNGAGIQFDFEGGEDRTFELEELVTGDNSIEIVEQISRSWGILDVHVGRARHTSTKEINRRELKRCL